MVCVHLPRASSRIVEAMSLANQALAQKAKEEQMKKQVKEEKSEEDTMPDAKDMPLLALLLEEDDGPKSKRMKKKEKKKRKSMVKMLKILDTCWHGWLATSARQKKKMLEEMIWPGRMLWPGRMRKPGWKRCWSDGRQVLSECTKRS